MANLASLMGKSVEVYGFQTLYREIGYYLSRLEQYDRALRFFDDAVSKTPHDLRALLGRAWARSKACQYEGALDDIRVALDLEPDDLCVLARKALNTYLSCEFESALVQNNRLIPASNQATMFVVAAMQCADAIENCVGERTGRPLRDHFKIIRKLAWKRNADAQKPYEPKPRYKKKKKKNKVATEERKIIQTHEPRKSISRARQLASRVSIKSVDMPTEEEDTFESIRDSVYTHKSEENIVPPALSFPFKPLQRYTDNLQNYMSEKYLHILYKDKIYLKQLENARGVNSPNKEGTKKIKELARFGYKSVKYRQELLRTRRPFYFIKYQEAKISGALKARQDAQMQKMRDDARKEAQNLVNKIKQGLAEKNLKQVLETAEKLKLYCDNNPKKILPERNNFLAVVYDSVCQGFYDLKRLNKNQFEWDQEKRIHIMLGIEVSREPSADSVIGNLQAQFVDWTKQIELYGLRLKRATKAPEMAWIYHELSRFYSELKQFELSRVYARKCLNEGKICDDQRWVINAMMLIMKNHILQHNKNEAKREARLGIGIAKNMQDPNLEEFMTKTLEAIEKTEFDDIHGPKVLQKREQKIVKIMADIGHKDEAAHLFRLMSTMPASRRMAVMPGVKVEDDSTEKSTGQRISIMPQNTFSGLSVTAVAKKRATKTREKEETGGTEFLEMIQYHIDD